MIASAQNDQLLFFPEKERRLMAEADRPCDALRGRGWITAKALGAQNPQWNERHLRRLAEISDGRILSGQTGYKLTVECTPEELGHATAWLRARRRRR